MFDLRFQQIIHTVSFRCLTFISPDLKRFQHETSTTLTATTNSSSHENTLFQRAHARFPLARGGYNNSRQCQSHFRSPTETPVSGLLLETNNKTIKLKCSAFDTGVEGQMLISSSLFNPWTNQRLMEFSLQVIWP